jgi:hypothetical protein
MEEKILEIEENSTLSYAYMLFKQSLIIYVILLSHKTLVKLGLILNSIIS